MKSLANPKSQPWRPILCYAMLCHAMLSTKLTHQRLSPYIMILLYYDNSSSNHNKNRTAHADIWSLHSLPQSPLNSANSANHCFLGIPRTLLPKNAGSALLHTAQYWFQRSTSNTFKFRPGPVGPVEIHEVSLDQAASSSSSPRY